MKIFIIREYYFLDNDVIIIRDSNDDDGSKYSWLEHPATLSYYQAVPDHLGSIIAVYDKSQRKVFEASYDAWGRQTIIKNDIHFNHGFTGHEMLPWIEEKRQLIKYASKYRSLPPGNKMFK